MVEAASTRGDTSARDEAARELARDVRRSIHLQAPAGSGKTTVLSQRFLAALAVADEPEEVLAITFTRKAAGEMRERVLKALAPGSQGPGAEAARWDALREAVQAQALRRGWPPEELPQRLRIQTIDSLAAELARAMPLLGRMQAGLQVVDDAGALHEEAARRTLAEGDRDADSHADIDRLLRRLDNNTDRARRLLAALLAGRSRWLPLVAGHSPDGLADVIQHSLQRIAADALGRMRELLPDAWRAEAAQIAAEAAREVAAAGKGGEDSPWLAPDAQLGDAPVHLPCWQAMAELLLVASSDALRARITVAQGIAPKTPLKARWQAWRDDFAAIPGAVELLCELRVLPRPVLDETEREVIAALARVLLLATAQLQLLCRERGVVDHSEVTLIARQALAAPEAGNEFALRQALRVSHLLVDECQDTSPEQIELVRALTAGWQRGDQRSLFLVGDPMQSIYLFRGSEVGLFLGTRNQGIGAIALQALQLTRNFRSQSPLVEWANAAFAHVFPAAENLRSSAVPFLPAVHARAVDTRIDAGVSVWPQQQEDPAFEAHAIAQEIAALRGRQPELSIAVLVQTRAVAAPILRALHAAGIATVGVDLAVLGDRPVVRDLLALGSALLDAGDRSAWLAVLRSPPCGLLLQDLQRLCEAAGDTPLVQHLQDDAMLARLSADGAQRLRRVGPILAGAWRLRASLDVAASIERCWQALGGEQACLDATELAASRQYLLALRQLQESEGRPAPRRLAELATRLRDRTAPAAGQPVEVLTIHRSKGLEWDVVFVPGLGRRPRPDQAPLLRWLQLPRGSTGEDLLMAVRSIGATQVTDPLAAYIDRLQRERQLHERQRLLYVAVTRARLRLYLSGHAPRDRKEGQPRPAPRSLLDLLWPVVGAQFLAEAAAQPLPEEAPAEPQPLAMLWHRLPAHWQPAPRPAQPLPRSLQQRQPEPGEGVEFSWVGPVARAAGTVLHAELEHLARVGETAVAQLGSRQGVCEAQLREQGIAPEEARRAAAALVQRLGEMVQEEKARWLLFEPHREAVSELPLSGMIGGELRSIVIDRMFVDAQGTRWIIDFKTGRHAGGGLEQFIEREVQRYTAQLRLYASLASRLGPEPVRAALYFPWLGVLGELPAGSSPAS